MIGRTLLVLTAVLVALAGPAAAHARSEYEVKAAFLFNIARFVEWPSSAGPEGAGEFRLCVVGEDPFGGALAALERRRLHGHRVVVRRPQSPLRMERCHLLFISPSAARFRVAAVLDAVARQPVLTVGDSPGLAERGVIVNLYLERGKVRFEVNLEAAKRAGITLSSRMLRLARIVGQDNG